MPTEIHGHEVMEMMTASAQVYTRDTLRAAITGKFGGDARFHTCSAANMDADALIDFLAERGKFSGDATAFTINPDKICQH